MIYGRSHYQVAVASGRDELRRQAVSQGKMLNLGTIMVNTIAALIKDNLVS